MRKLITALIVGVLGYQGYAAYQRATLAHQDAESPRIEEPRREFSSFSEPVSSKYNCDGRTHCSQMTSCEEATWFINHCPGTEMDGNNDGVPCERQWCGR